MVEARADGPRYRTRYQARGHTGLADTRKGEAGGDTAPRPHELLEAALATCIAISAQMALDELGLDGAAAARVSLERSPTASTFIYEVSLDPSLTAEQRRGVREQIEQSPVRRTLANPISFTPQERS